MTNYYHPFRRGCTTRLLLGMIIIHFGITSAFSSVPPEETTCASSGVISLPYISLSRTEQENFYRGLNAFSEKTKIAFIVEGVPLYKILDTAQAQKLATESLEKELPLKDALVRFASAYGYQAEATQVESLFLLRKKYIDPADLPPVTFSECLLAMKDLLRILAAFAPRLPKGQDQAASITRQLIGSMSQEQLSKMASGANLQQGARIRRLRGSNSQSPEAHLKFLGLSESAETALAIGVPVRDLSPSQRGIARESVAFLYLGQTFSEVQAAERRGEDIASQDPVFLFKAFDGNDVFGYQYVSSENRSRNIGFVPLSDTDHVQEHRGVITVYPRRVSTISPLTQTPNLRPMERQTSVLHLNSAPTSSEGVTTLRQAVERLNLASINDDEKFIVDDALAQKSVILIGEAKVTPQQMLKGLTVLYGLRVIPNKDGQKLITRPYTVIPAEIADVPAALAKALPLSLARAVEGVPKDREGMGATISLEAKIEAIKNAAMRQLQTSVEPRLKVTKDHQIQLSQCGPEVRDLIGLIVILDCLIPVNQITKTPVPDIIGHFDDIILTGGLFQDDRHPERTFCHLWFGSKNGEKVSQGPGIPMVPYNLSTLPKNP